ncbi:MAG: hypothetical protein ACYDH5_14690 [Acidimicrobiales bacterium]
MDRIERSQSCRQELARFIEQRLVEADHMDGPEQAAGLAKKLVVPRAPRWLGDDQLHTNAEVSR